MIKPRRGRYRSLVAATRTSKITLGTGIHDNAEQRGKTLRTSEWTPKVPPADLLPLSLPPLYDDPNRRSAAAIQRGVRGPTMKENLDPPVGRRWVVEMNDQGQAVGKAAANLSKKLGIYSRVGNYFPINARSWKQIPDKSLLDIWFHVENQYDFQDHPEAKYFVFSSLNRKWKDWKGELKREHYDNHQTDKERIRDCNSKVDPHQWKDLVQYWGTPEGKAACERNRANRAWNKKRSRTGTKSHPAVKNELCQQSLAMMDVIDTDKNENGPSSMHRDTATTLRHVSHSEASNAAKGDALTHECEPEKPGCGRKDGLNRTNNDVIDIARHHEREMVTRLLEENWELREINRRLEKDNQKLKKKMESMNNKLKMVMVKLDIYTDESDSENSSKMN